MTQPVTVFSAFPFKVGQKIFIKDSRRAGDWEVRDVSESKVTLRCPVSGKEFKWDRFCYFVEESDREWPSD